MFSKGVLIAWAFILLICCSRFYMQAKVIKQSLLTETRASDNHLVTKSKDENTSNDRIEPNNEYGMINGESDGSSVDIKEENTGSKLSSSSYFDTNISSINAKLKVSISKLTNGVKETKNKEIKLSSLTAKNRPSDKQTDGVVEGEDSFNEAGKQDLPSGMDSGNHVPYDDRSKAAGDKEDEETPATTVATNRLYSGTEKEEIIHSVGDAGLVDETSTSQETSNEIRYSGQQFRISDVEIENGVQSKDDDDDSGDDEVTGENMDNSTRLSVQEASNNDCYGSVSSILKHHVPSQSSFDDSYVKELIAYSKFKREILYGAVAEGAVCLDGSPPAVYFRKGSGSGKKKWIFFFEGGAWCYDVEECYARSKMELGTSTRSKRYFIAGGFLSREKNENPHFYNWNTVVLDYCDGSSFSSDRLDPVLHNRKYLYFRGKRIRDYIVDEFLSRGMRYAEHVIVSGRSAGGLAAMLHADYIRNKIPKSSKYHVLSDGGFFLDIKSKKGTYEYRKKIKSLVKLHNITSGVNERCAVKHKNKLWKCLFPQYFVSDIKSPLFMVNSLYDTWSIGSIYGVRCTMWDYTSCNFEEAALVLRYRRKTLTALKRSHFKKSSKGGFFFIACVTHCTCATPKWTLTSIGNANMENAFYQWMNGNHSYIKRIDGEFPDNHSC